MEHAKVLLVEDKVIFHDAVRDVLENSGHILIEPPVDNIEKALEILDQIKAGELPCDVIILDGHLSRKSANGEDARIIDKRSRELNLAVYIIGFSATNMSDYGIVVNADPTKDGYAQIPSIIDSFPEPGVA